MKTIMAKLSFTSTTPTFLKAKTWKAKPLEILTVISLHEGRTFSSRNLFNRKPFDPWLYHQEPFHQRPFYRKPFYRRLFYRRPFYRRPFYQGLFCQQPSCQEPFFSEGLFTKSPLIGALELGFKGVRSSLTVQRYLKFHTQITAQPTV